MVLMMKVKHEKKFDLMLKEEEEEENDDYDESKK